MIKLPFFNKTATSENRFLAVNIDSDYVRCLAMYNEGGSIKILGTGKQELDPGKVRAGSIVFADQVAQAMEAATAQALQDVGGDVTDTIFGVSGDLCLGLMTTIKAKRTHPAPINQKEINELTERIDQSAYLQAQNEYMQINGNPENELETVTNSMVYLKLDGQKVSGLKDKTGTTIEMAVFNAFVPSHHISSLQKVAKEAGLNIMAIGSEMYCLVQTINAAHQPTDFIVVEVDGDYTTVAVVFGGGIVGTRTLNVGYRHLIEGVSERMGITMVEAAKVLKSYTLQKLTNSEVVIVKNALKAPLEIWLAGLELLFAEYSGVKTFAPKIFLTGEGLEVSDLWEALNDQEWTKSIPFKSPPELERLTFMDLNTVTDSTGHAAGSEWLPSACLSVIKLEMDKSDD